MVTRTDDTVKAYWSHGGSESRINIYLEGWGDYVNIVIPNAWTNNVGSSLVQVRLTKTEAKKLLKKLYKIFLGRSSNGKGIG